VPAHCDVSQAGHIRKVVVHRLLPVAHQLDDELNTARRWDRTSLDSMSPGRHLHCSYIDSQS
jgi:hypothetical protein